MTVVQHTLTGADGGPLRGAVVTVSLASVGYVPTGQREIVAIAATTTDTTGAYQFDLTPQSQINPAGTHYQVTHPGGETLAFVVTDAAGPLWLFDLLTTTPDVPVLSVIDGGTAATN